MISIKPSSITTILLLLSLTGKIIVIKMMNFENQLQSPELFELFGASPPLKSTNKASNDSGYFSSPVCNPHEEYDLLKTSLTTPNEDKDDITTILSMIPKCTGCGQSVFEKEIIQIEGTYWHEKCVQCCECSTPLSRRAFLNDSSLYCHQDYYKYFGAKCTKCCQDISVNEVVRKAGNSVFHVRCFKCLLCNKKLETGDPFYLTNDNKLVCNQNHENITLRDDIDHSEIKRPRSVITNKQQMALNAVYNQNPKPPRNVREHLSRTIGLDMRVVQVWFQNRRAKERRVLKQPTFDLLHQLEI